MKKRVNKVQERPKEWKIKVRLYVYARGLLTRFCGKGIWHKTEARMISSKEFVDNRGWNRDEYAAIREWSNDACRGQVAQVQCKLFSFEIQASQEVTPVDTLSNRSVHCVNRPFIQRPASVVVNFVYTYWSWMPLIRMHYRLFSRVARK